MIYDWSAIFTVSESASLDLDVERPAIARGIGTLKPPQIHHLN